MAAKPVAVVFGATGAQGGSVARALAADYQVRTITRDPSKPSAKQLESLGIDVRRGDITDLESVRSVLQGADTAFLVTSFWEHMDKAREVAENKPVIDAIAAAGVKHFVFSTLENVTKATEGRITRVAHFDGKGELTDYAKSKGIPSVFVMMAMYVNNFLAFFPAQPQPDGSRAITLPDMHGAKCNYIAVEDLGPAVASILRDWDHWVGKEVPLVGELATLNEGIQTLADVIGKPLKYNPVPYDVFASFPFPGAADMADMFRFYEEGPIDRSTEPLHRLNPGYHTVRRWAEENKEALIKALGFA